MWIIGNEYRHSNVDRYKLPADGLPWWEKNYVVKVRRFAKGAVEVVTHRIDPTKQMKFADSAAYGGLLASSKRREEGEAERDPEERKADNRARTCRRARQQVRFGVKAIGADHLLTLTYRTRDGVPMNDIDRLKADWDRFRRLVKRGLPACGKWGAHKGIDDWRFVAVREKQDNGAYHLHVAVVGRQDINFIRRCWFVAIGGNQDDSGDQTRGNIDVRGPSKRWGAKTAEWRCDKLAGYMTKYLHKTFDDLDEAKFAKRYWAGRGNEKPEVIRYWIGAADFCEAIQQTHAMFKAECRRAGYRLWASDGYESIWLSG